MRKNLIIDSNNLLHRVHWVCSKYTHISEPKMFLTCVRKYIDDHMITKDRVYMVWDDKLYRKSTNYRKQAIDGMYKSTRDKQRNKTVYTNSKPIRQICSHLGFMNMHPGCLEADDVIAYLSRRLPGHNTIVSVDQDMLQLVDESTDVYDPMKKRIITEENFEEYIPVPRADFITYKAAMGDKSDNIPGIPKIGNKRAIELTKSGTDHLISEHREILDRNRELIDLKYGLIKHPEEKQLYDKQLVIAAQEQHIDFESIHNICQEHEYTDMTQGFLTTFNYENTLTRILS